MSNLNGFLPELVSTPEEEVGGNGKRTVNVIAKWGAYPGAYWYLRGVPIQGHARGSIKITLPGTFGFMRLTYYRKSPTFNLVEYERGRKRT